MTMLAGYVTTDLYPPTTMGPEWMPALEAVVDPVLQLAGIYEGTIMVRDPKHERAAQTIHWFLYGEAPFGW